MDFDSPAAAQKAVASLKASGVQAQMAKVSFTPSVILPSSLSRCFLVLLSSCGTQSLCLKPWSNLRQVLLASEVMADDIGSQVIIIDRIIDNDNDNYVLH